MNALTTGEPTWIDETLVRAIHRRQLAEHRGTDGMRAEGLLAAALYRPRHIHHYHHGCGLARLAAAYGYGLVTSHPFIQGNTRTAYLVMRLFLARHGWTVAATRPDKYRIMRALAAGKLTEEALAEWLAQGMMAR